MSSAWQLATVQFALTPTAGVPLLRILGGTAGQLLTTSGNADGDLGWTAGGGGGAGGPVLVDNVSIVGDGEVIPLSVAVVDGGTF